VNIVIQVVKGEMVKLGSRQLIATQPPVKTTERFNGNLIPLKSGEPRRFRNLPSYSASIRSMHIDINLQSDSAYESLLLDRSHQATGKVPSVTITPRHSHGIERPDGLMVKRSNVNDADDSCNVTDDTRLRDIYCDDSPVQDMSSSLCT
jgi:hypothetical protein